MLTYENAVRKQGIPEYTEDEALASLASAYSRPACSTVSGRQSPAEKLVELAMKHAELVHTADSVAYALISSDAHREVRAVKSKFYRQWLSRAFFEKYGKVPKATSIADAILPLEGQALFVGSEVKVDLRVAEHEGTVIIDLCNASWECKFPRNPG